MKRTLVGLAAVALVGTLSPTDARAAGCSVALSGPTTCTYLVLKSGTGQLSLTVTAGVAVASVTCTSGSAGLPGSAPYSGSTTFTRFGLCYLQIAGSGSATASAT